MRCWIQTLGKQRWGRKGHPAGGNLLRGVSAAPGRGTRAAFCGKQSVARARRRAWLECPERQDAAGMASAPRRQIWPPWNPQATATELDLP